jgi:predicted RNA-binding Zn-ribbon protein involved in translation (DUF1610 family)
MITLLLALAFIYMGFTEFISNRTDNGSLNLTLGVAILAISTYLLFQTKRRPTKLGTEIQPLNTTVKCQKCGFNNVREFQRGDYVFKQMDEPCPKCNEKTLSVAAIFREVKEKTKRSMFD